MNIHESIHLKLALTEKEYIQFFLYMRMKTNLVVLTCGFFLYMLFLFVVTDFPLLINIIISALFILLLIIPLALLGLINKAKKEFKSNYSLSKEVIVKFEDSGFKLTTEHECNDYDWNYLYSVREIKKGFVLYYSANTAFALPKRCFNSEQEMNLFKELVLEHLNTNRVHFNN
jgi:hypothetical protein